MNESWFVDQEQWMIFVTTVTGALYSSQVGGLQVWMCGMYAILLVCSCPQIIWNSDTELNGSPLQLAIGPSSFNDGRLGGRTTLARSITAYMNGVPLQTFFSFFMFLYYCNKYAQPPTGRGFVSTPYSICTWSYYGSIIYLSL